MKNEAHLKYKQYQNILSAFLKRSKQSYFTNYFQTDIDDLKKYLKKYQKANISKKNCKFCVFNSY